MIENDCTNENWKPLKNYETFYSVSNLGNIRREKAYNGKCKAGRILKTRLANDGYLRLNISADKKRATYKVHHLVALTFLGGRPAGLVVNHIDGNKLNNRAENLEYVSPKGNIEHATKMGLMPAGERHYSNNSLRLTEKKNHCAKLTPEDVQNIRKLATEGVSSRVIAEKFHISKSHARNIINNRTWVI